MNTEDRAIKLLKEFVEDDPLNVCADEGTWCLHCDGELGFYT